MTLQYITEHWGTDTLKDLFLPDKSIRSWKCRLYKELNKRFKSDVCVERLRGKDADIEYKVELAGIVREIYIDWRRDMFVDLDNSPQACARRKWLLDQTSYDSVSVTARCDKEYAMWFVRTMHILFLKHYLRQHPKKIRF